MKTMHQKIKIVSELFRGLTNVYGTYDLKTGKTRQVKEPVTKQVIMKHIAGYQLYAVYLLVNNKTSAIVVDFDIEDRLKPVRFMNCAIGYGLSPYVERSKSKGYHVWIFFEKQGVLASKARLVVRHILNEIDEKQAEVFPKHDEINENLIYSNCINTPLFGGLTPKRRTVFIDPATFKPYPDQWAFLESVKRYDESLLDNIIKANGIISETAYSVTKSITKPVNENTFSLPPCAQKMLREGVSQYQRVSCFRLAVHLKRIGLPCDCAVASLKVWASKNQPINGKWIITFEEIKQQASDAYNKNYQSFGCEHEAIMPFCESECPIYKKIKNTED